MQTHTAISLLLFVGFHVGSAETGCPEPEDILPCTCNQFGLTIYLECKNLEDSESLRNVFINSARYKYSEVHLEFSTLQYLPHDMFESVRVSDLYLTNVTLTKLFDSPPEALDELRKLHIENTVVLRGILWELLKPLKSLKIIEVYFSTFKTLGKDFSENAPKELQQLALYGTETKTIQSGVFEEFTKLDKIEISGCKLSELSRDILPTPFNGRYLYFNENKISVIPDDMFSQMPNLDSVQLRNNQISTIPETAFEGNGGKLINLSLSDNPIKCDCRLLWLIQNKPTGLSGKCESPKKLHDKELRDVSPSDMNC